MYIRQNTFNFASKSRDVAYLPPLWRQAFLINDEGIALHIQSWRFWEQEKRRQARKFCGHLKDVWRVTIKIIYMESS